MEKDEKLTLEQIKDLFTIQVILNNLLEKFDNSHNLAQSNAEDITSIKTAIKSIEDNISTMSEQIKDIADNLKKLAPLYEENRKLRSDNTKLVKASKKIEEKPKDSISEEPELEEKVTKEEKQEEWIVQSAKKLLEHWKKKNYNFLNRTDLPRSFKFNEAQLNKIIEFMREKGALTGANKRVIDYNIKL